MTMAGWVVSGLVLVAVLWAAAVYNRLAQTRNRIANAFGQIDVQLKRRHDLVPNLVEVAKRYLAHEASTLQAVTRARGRARRGRRRARRAHQCRRHRRAGPGRADPGRQPGPAARGRGGLP